MLIALILLSFLCVISLVLLVISVKQNINAGRQLRSYDMFFNDTIEDADEIVNFINKLSKKDIMFLDPDVQKLVSAMTAFKDMLIGYLNNGKQPGREERKE